MAEVEVRDAVFTLSPEARDEIASAGHRVNQIGDWFGKSSKQYLDAATSWSNVLSSVFGRPYGDAIHVYREGRAGELSLLVVGGITIGVIFSQDRRTCTKQECQVYINDDGREYRYNPLDPSCGDHELSWPLNVHPGTWSTHS